MPRLPCYKKARRNTAAQFDLGCGNIRAYIHLNASPVHSVSSKPKSPSWRTSALWPTNHLPQPLRPSFICSLVNEGDLLEAHGLLMVAPVDDAGCYCRGGVDVIREERLLHMALSADRVPHLMAALLNWVASTDFHPRLSSCLFHYFVTSGAAKNLMCSIRGSGKRFLTSFEMTTSSNLSRNVSKHLRSHVTL